MSKMKNSFVDNILSLKHYPFVFQRTINKLAEQIQLSIKQDLKSNLHIRKDWVGERSKFGVRVRYASKSKLEARVFTNAPWLPRHEEGGEQRPEKARRFAIASHEHWSRESILPRSKKIARLTSRTFFIKSKKTGDTIFFKRFGPRSKHRFGHGRGGESAKRLKLLYILRPSIRLNKRIHFFNVAASIVKSSLAATFRDELAKAISRSK